MLLLSGVDIRSVIRTDYGENAESMRKSENERKMGTMNPVEVATPRLTVSVMMSKPPTMLRSRTTWRLNNWQFLIEELAQVQSCRHETIAQLPARQLDKAQLLPKQHRRKPIDLQYRWRKTASYPGTLVN